MYFHLGGVTRDTISNLINLIILSGIRTPPHLWIPESQFCFKLVGFTLITALYFKITVTFVFVSFRSRSTTLKLMFSFILLLVDVSYLIIPWGGRMVIKLYTHKIMLAILNIIHLAIFNHNLIKEKLRYFRFEIWIFSCILIQSASSKRDMKNIDMVLTFPPENARNLDRNMHWI